MASAYYHLDTEPGSPELLQGVSASCLIAHCTPGLSWNCHGFLSCDRKTLSGRLEELEGIVFKKGEVVVGEEPKHHMTIASDEDPFKNISNLPQGGGFLSILNWTLKRLNKDMLSQSSHKNRIVCQESPISETQALTGRRIVIIINEVYSLREHPYQSDPTE